MLELSKKKKNKNMNRNMTINSQLSITKPRKTKNKNKNKLSKQLKQERNHRNGDHMECYQWGGERGRECGNSYRE